MLTALKVEKLTAAGRYRDGEVKGLYLQVSDGGTKSWLLRYEFGGRERWMGLGSADTFSLKAARERARAARQQIADGIDPITAKRVAKATATQALTFREAAEKYLNQHQIKWSNAKHRDQFLASLNKFAFPIIGALPVAVIDTAAVLRVLEQTVPAGNKPGLAAGCFWAVRPETAERVRGRIESTLDWCKVRGLRDGDNPARWRGHLREALPARRHRTQHHPALPYVELPKFIAGLGKTVAARALEFTILTAVRTSEAAGARWSEIDFEAATWTVPAERMKTRRTHIVPLSPQAVDLLRSLLVEEGNEHVFIGHRPGSALSNAAMGLLMRGMGVDATVHGFRSSFRVWAAERTNYPREVCEAALAHVVGNSVERAYQRSDLFSHRARLMAEWASYCYAPPSAGTVVPMRGAR